MPEKLKKKDFKWRISHPSTSFEQLRNAIRSFGIYVYSDPAWKLNSDYAFIVSKRKLNQKEIREVSKLYNPEEFFD